MYTWIQSPGKKSENDIYTHTYYIYIMYMYGISLEIWVISAPGRRKLGQGDHGPGDRSARVAGLARPWKDSSCEPRILVLLLLDLLLL